MNANDIRLYEHIKLLQRGVELFQQHIGKSCEGLANGFNGQKVRIGLLGATSSGKTTLIKRLLSEAAGKISSRPETACLVVHSFARAESIVLSFNSHVAFEEEQISSEFGDFLKEFKIKDNYRAINKLEWELQSDEHERTLDCHSDKILEFFEQVNKFDKVFSKIRWNHKQRKADYNLTDLFDIYDLPGFGGKEVHDQTVEKVFDEAKFDVLVYLIDTGRGVPGADEMRHLQTVQKYLDKNRETIFYWAYEKEAQEKIVIEEKRCDIDQAIETGGCATLPCRSNGLLDLTGPEDGDCEILRSKVLGEILRPYFADEGKRFVDSTYRKCDKDEDVKERIKRVIDEDTSLPLIQEVLDEIEKFGKEAGEVCTQSQAKKILIEWFLGKEYYVKWSASKDSSQKNDLAGALLNGSLANVPRMIIKKCHSLFEERRRVIPAEGSSCSDRETAYMNVSRRILSSVNKIVDSISRECKVDLTKIRSFKSEVYDHDVDIRTLVYDVQQYWILRDSNGVLGYIKDSMTEPLQDNIRKEVEAITEFSPEEE